MKELFLPVRKVPIQEVVKGYKTNSSLSHLIITETPEGPRIINACSKNYTLVTNEEIFKPLEDALGDEYEIEKRVAHSNYSRFYVDYNIKDKSMPVLKKDMVLPRVRVMNSYDGSLKFSFKFGFYRVICENGLSVPIKGIYGGDSKRMHTPGLSTYVDDLMELTGDFIKESKDLLQGYKAMAEAKLTLEEAIRAIEHVLANTKAPKKKKENMVDRLQKEHKEQGLPYSNWLVYNAINYELNHGTSSTAPHKLDKIDAKVLNLLMP